MKYHEGELLIKITGLEQTADQLGIKPTTELDTVDAYRHLNRVSALLEDIGIDFDEMSAFFDDLAQAIHEEYNRLPREENYPEMSLPAYDRWFREILEAVRIAHVNFHETRLAQLQALEINAEKFIDKTTNTYAGEKDETGK